MKGCRARARKYDVSPAMTYWILNTVFRIVTITQCSLILVLLGINISEVSV